MRSTCGVMINYAMLHYNNLNYNNLNYRHYKSLCMRYKVTNHHDTYCFWIAGGYSLLFIPVVLIELLNIWHPTGLNSSQPFKTSL